MTAQSDGTLISATGFSTNWANKPGTSTSEFDYTGKLSVEFELVETTDSNYAQFQLYDGGNVLVKRFALRERGHWKFIIDGDKAIPYYNGVQQSDLVTDTGNLLTTFRIGFRVHTGFKFKFKNFMICSI